MSVGTSKGFCGVLSASRLCGPDRVGGLLPVGSPPGSASGVAAAPWCKRRAAGNMHLMQMAGGSLASCGTRPVARGLLVIDC